MDHRKKEYKQHWQMENSSLLRNSTLRQVNFNVLKMINHKKYPLNQQKLQHIQHNKEKYNLSKLHTCPNESTTSLYTTSSSSRKLKPREIGIERSMGELFQEEQARKLMLNKIGNSDLEEISEKINNYVWNKKRQLVAKLESQAEPNSKQSEKPIIRKKMLVRRGSINSMNSFISRLRKRMKEDFMRDSQAIDNPIERYTEPEEQRESLDEHSMNFFEGNEEMLGVMKRYPLKPHEMQPTQETSQLAFEKDVAEEIRSSLMSDKFSRMRITINHRKIVSIR